MDNLNYTHLNLQSKLRDIATLDNKLIEFLGFAGVTLGFSISIHSTLSQKTYFKIAGISFAVISMLFSCIGLTIPSRPKDRELTEQTNEALFKSQVTSTWSKSILELKQIELVKYSLLALAIWSLWLAALSVCLSVVNVSLYCKL